MNNTLAYILNKYHLDPTSAPPVFIPYKRSDLAALFNELGFKTGAEIGVFAGQYSKILCESIPGLKLYCIDAWVVYDDLPETKVAKHYKNYIRRIEGTYAAAGKLLQGYSCEFIKKYSMDAVTGFTRDSLDFVYIDANHAFDYVMEDIIEWSKIVRPGGIISGHDYHCFKYNEVSFQVSSAVNVYTNVHDIKPLFVFSGDHSTSWAFVKV